MSGTCSASVLCRAHADGLPAATPCPAPNPPALPLPPRRAVTVVEVRGVAFTWRRHDEAAELLARARAEGIDPRQLLTEAQAALKARDT